MPLAEPAEAALAAPFSALPLPLLFAILALLPVDARLLCAAVCRAWRAAVKDRSLWMHVDLSPVSGVARPILATHLRGYPALAGGQLRSLEVANDREQLPELLAVLAANAGTLTALTLHRCKNYALGLGDYVQLIRSAPLLLTVRASVVGCHALEARSVLRNEPPYGLVRVLQRLIIEYDAESDAPDEPPVSAVTADVAAQPSISELELCYAEMDGPRAWDALVDATLAQRLKRLSIRECRVRPGTGAALTRVLSSTTLTQLDIAHFEQEEALFNTPAAAAAFAAAVRANNTLVTLAIVGIALWREATEAATILAALTSHPSLSSLGLYHVWPLDEAAYAQPLAALVRVNAPALGDLTIGGPGVGDDNSLGEVFSALAHNTHLHTFSCIKPSLSDELVLDFLMPALHANYALRKLTLGVGVEETAAMRNAMDFIAARVTAPDA